MEHFLTIHRPHGYDFSQITAEVMRDIDASTRMLPPASASLLVDSKTPRQPPRSTGAQMAQLKRKTARSSTPSNMSMVSG
ncbi:MAG: hypothetical protein R2688_02600 [Fimbriimonadaceae bacterium]